MNRPPPPKPMNRKGQATTSGKLKKPPPVIPKAQIGDLPDLKAIEQSQLAAKRAAEQKIILEEQKNTQQNANQSMPTNKEESIQKQQQSRQPQDIKSIIQTEPELSGANLQQQNPKERNQQQINEEQQVEAKVPPKIPQRKKPVPGKPVTKGPRVAPPAPNKQRINTNIKKEQQQPVERIDEEKEENIKQQVGTKVPENEEAADNRIQIEEHKREEEEIQKPEQKLQKPANIVKAPPKIGGKALGKNPEIRKLPIPKKPVTIPKVSVEQSNTNEPQQSNNKIEQAAKEESNQNQLVSTLNQVQFHSEQMAEPEPYINTEAQNTVKPENFSSISKQPQPASIHIQKEEKKQPEKQKKRPPKPIQTTAQPEIEKKLTPKYLQLRNRIKNMSTTRQKIFDDHSSQDEQEAQDIQPQQIRKTAQHSENKFLEKVVEKSHEESYEQIKVEKNDKCQEIEDEGQFSNEMKVEEQPIKQESLKQQKGYSNPFDDQQQNGLVENLKVEFQDTTAIQTPQTDQPQLSPPFSEMKQEINDGPLNQENVKIQENQFEEVQTEVNAGVFPGKPTNIPTKPNIPSKNKGLMMKPKDPRNTSKIPKPPTKIKPQAPPPKTHQEKQQIEKAEVEQVVTAQKQNSHMHSLQNDHKKEEESQNNLTQEINVNTEDHQDQLQKEEQEFEMPAVQEKQDLKQEQQQPPVKEQPIIPKRTINLGSIQPEQNKLEQLFALFKQKKHQYDSNLAHYQQQCRKHRDEEQQKIDTINHKIQQLRIYDEQAFQTISHYS